VVPNEADKLDKVEEANDSEYDSEEEIINERNDRLEEQAEQDLFMGQLD
jgi:hypothetical protein